MLRVFLRGQRVRTAPIHPQAQLPPQSSVSPDCHQPNCFAERTGVKVPLTKAGTVVFSCQKAYKYHCSVWRVRKRTTGASTLAMSIMRTTRAHSDVANSKNHKFPFQPSWKVNLPALSAVFSRLCSFWDLS